MGHGTGFNFFSIFPLTFRGGLEVRSLYQFTRVFRGLLWVSGRGDDPVGSRTTWGMFFRKGTLPSLSLWVWSGGQFWVPFLVGGVSSVSTRDHIRSGLIQVTTKDLRSGSKRRRRVSVRSSSGVELVGSIKKAQTRGPGRQVFSRRGRKCLSRSNKNQMGVSQYQPRGLVRN